MRSEKGERRKNSHRWGTGAGLGVFKKLISGNELEELESPTRQVSDDDDDDEMLKAVLSGCIRKITNNTSKGITSKTTENEDKEEAGVYLRTWNSASGERYVGLLVNTLFLVVNEGLDMKP